MFRRVGTLFLPQLFSAGLPIRRRPLELLQFPPGLTGVNYFFPSTTITFPVLLSYLDHGGNGMRA
jgi:hypothetical protein